MRTDVKVGLICAFAIVLCVVVYFVVRGNGKPTAARADNTRSTAVDTPRSTPAPAPMPAVSDPSLTDHTMASGGAGSPVGGGFIGLPGGGGSSGVASGSPAAASGGPAGALGSPAGALGTPAAPGMGPTPIGGGPTPTPLTLLPTTMPAVRPTLEFGPGTGSMLVTTPGGATTYKIQKGDMLGAVAKKFGVTVKAIEAANTGIDSTRLKINAEIKIPAPTPTVATTRPSVTGTPATGAVTARPGTGTTGTVGARPATTGTPAAVAAVTIKPGTTYTVKKGDTLTTIAKAAYGATGSWAKIFKANRATLDDPDLVPVGTQITIPQ